MSESSECSRIQVGYSKCIKCGESYDITKTSTTDNSSCSFDAIHNFCPKCRPKLTLGQQVIGFTYVGGVFTWFLTRDMVLKPTIRAARKLFKGLSDWADR